MTFPVNQQMLCDSPQLKHRFRIPGLALLAFSLLLGCGGRDTGPPPKGDSVLLVVIEALPADRLGCYGGEYGVSPHIDDIAENGILFEHFHSASPWTMPSFGSILSGLSPPLHRAGRFMPDPRDPTKLSADLFGLLDDIPFLPQLLKGVVRSAVVNNSFLHKDYGFERSWDNYNQHKAGYTGYRLGRDTTQAAIKLLRTHRNESHFMMLHYFDPHVPYRPKPPYDKKFHRGKKGRVQMRTVAQLKEMRRNKFWPDSEEQDYMLGLQNGEIAYTDNEIGKLVDAMAEMDLLDKTWLVITADHGEELFEHGGFEHGHRYEEEVTKVPLIIRPPKGRWMRGERVKPAARHIDLAPTILHWFGKQVPKEMEGRSLMPLVTGRETAHRPTYMGFNLTDDPAHAYYDGKYKIIETLDHKEIYMYDVAGDPKEKHRLNEKHPEFAGMKKTLTAIHERYEKKGAEIFSKRNNKKISKEVLDSLRSLGYID